LLQYLNTENNIIVSAPTSFGKSLLIEEIVASRVFNNIVIIQPTLALLDETRKKLQKYNEHYKLIIRTSQKYSHEKGNIFLFTAERVNEYRDFTNIDFLVIDEFYKLSGSRDDERSSSLNNAFHLLLKKFKCKFYLLGPNIDEISKGFVEKYNAIFFKTNFSLADTKTINYFKDYEGQFGEKGEKKIYKEKILFKLLNDLKNEQTIIYCSSPNKVRYLSKEFSSYLESLETQKSNENLPLIEWIYENVSDTWSVIKNLNYGIGIHDGALQKHITTSTIDYFNLGKLKYLFCTTTIIEGVNTSAKNIIFFDKTKGVKKPIDYFDYSNIKGRAGRMMEHYVGKIFNFNSPPDNEKIIIDIPFFQQNPIKDEVLVQLDREEVINKDSKQYREISKIPDVEIELIKKNGVRVHGQKSIIDKLRKEIREKHNLLYWNNYPQYKQLEYVIELAWDNLIYEGETINPMTKKKLVKVTFDYGYHNNIRFLVHSNFVYLRKLESNKMIVDSDLMDKAICDSFQIMKHWFQYKIPKWLSVINELQKFVCNEFGLRPGSYTYYANLIENDFLRENLAILAEYGIPSSAIRKLEKLIPKSIDQDDVLLEIRDKKLYENILFIEYEKEKMKENILEKPLKQDN